MTYGGRVMYSAPMRFHVAPVMESRHYYILLRALSRREVHHPQHFERFRHHIPPFMRGNPRMAESSPQIDVAALIAIANRIGDAEAGMNEAQAVINNAQAAKDSAQAQADAIVAKAAQDVTAAQGQLAKANSAYTQANADLRAFVNGLDMPAPTPPPAGQPAAAS